MGSVLARAAAQSELQIHAHVRWDVLEAQPAGDALQAADIPWPPAALPGVGLLAAMAAAERGVPHTRCRPLLMCGSRTQTVTGAPTDLCVCARSTPQGFHVY